MPVRVVANQKKASAAAVAGPLGGQAGGAPGELLFGLPKPPPGTPQLPAGISLCMIVKNEERFLHECLASIAPHVDEICIFDTGSTDRTVEIATSFNATVKLGEWRNDFSWARNEAIGMATRRWIIMLDADEVLRPDSREPLRALGTVPAHVTGVWLRCFSKSDDYKGSGFMSNAIIRIFPNNPRIRFRNPIHEFVTIDGSLSGLDARLAPIAIDHYGYTTEMIAARKKAERNLAIAKAATESHPEDAFNWSNYGLTAYINDDAETAIMALEKMRRMVGNEARGYIPNSLATLADIYCERRADYETAAEIARDCIKRSPRFANAHFMLGKAYTRMQRWEDARQAYQAAIDSGRYNEQQFVVDDEVPLWKAPSEIGVTYVHEGRYQEALEWFDRGLVNRPSAQPLRINRAKALENLQRFDDAEDELKRTWLEYKDDATTVGYVNFLLRRKANVQALEIIDQSVEHVSSDCAASLLTTAATLCRQLGLNERFEACLRKTLEFQPGNGETLATLEQVYKMRNDTSKLAELQRAELTAPCFHPSDFARRAARWLAENEPEKAREAALEGLKKSPGDATLLYNAAAAEIRLNEHPAAIEHLRGIGRDNAEIFTAGTYLRSLLLHQAGSFEAALAATDDLLALEPMQFDALMLRAKCLAALGRDQEAERVLRMLPLADQRVSVELAGLLVKLGRFEEAGRLAESALARA